MVAAIEAGVDSGLLVLLDTGEHVATGRRRDGDAEGLKR
jgi:hypothetical protein